MNDAAATYADLFKQASASDEVRMVKEAVGKYLAGAGLLGLGGLGGTLLGKKLEREKAEEQLLKERALTFGAGALAGIAGPPLLKKIQQSAGSSGLTSYGGDDYYGYIPDQFGSI